MDESPKVPLDSDSPEARREFLKKCGKFAAVTPPAMALLLSVSSVPQEAFASTIGHHPPGGPPPRPPFWPTRFPMSEAYPAIAGRFEPAWGLGGHRGRSAVRLRWPFRGSLGGATSCAPHRGLPVAGRLTRAMARARWLALLDGTVNLSV